MCFRSNLRCVFAQFHTNVPQFHTNVYTYVKYIDQSCCETLMDIGIEVWLLFFFFFFFFIFFFFYARACTWTQFIYRLIIIHFSNLVLFQIKAIHEKSLHMDTIYISIDYYTFPKLSSLSNKSSTWKYFLYLYVLIHILLLE